MPVRLPALVVLAALALPGAWAAPAEGSFVVEGRLALPEATTLDLGSRAAFLASEEGDGFETFRLEAKSLLVHRFEVRGPEVGSTVNVQPLPQWTIATYALTDAVVTLTAGDHRGWVGFYLPSSGGRLAVEGWGPSALRGTSTARLGNGQSASNEAEGPMPSYPAYEWESTQPLALLEGSGVLRQAGLGAMKVLGPDLRIEARENVTTYATGETTSGQPPLRERTIRWLYLEYVDADAAVGSRERIEVAADLAQVGWSGTARLTPVAGEMRSGGGTYAATGRTESVTGDLYATIAPVATAATVRLTVKLDGDLAQTSLASMGAAAPLAPDPPPWAWWVAAIAAVGVLLLVTARAVGASRRQKPISPDERVALAHLAAERDRFHEAVEHVREARQQAPGSVRLLMEEASYLGAMGQVDAALAQYEEAARLDPECDAPFQAAVLLLQWGGDLARAEGLLAAALRKNPILVLEVAYDGTGTFERLRGRPAFEAAVADAQRSLGE